MSVGMTLPDQLCLNLRIAGHDPDRSTLHVAFDTHVATILDLISVPAGDTLWWIVRDGLARELLRPVAAWYDEHRRFVLTVNSHDQAVSVAASPDCANMQRLPHGVRGIVAIPMSPGFMGMLLPRVSSLVEAGMGVVASVLDAAYCLHYASACSLLSSDSYAGCAWAFSYGVRRGLGSGQSDPSYNAHLDSYPGRPGRHRLLTACPLRRRHQARSWCRRVLCVGPPLSNARRGPHDTLPFRSLTAGSLLVASLSRSGSGHVRHARHSGLALPGQGRERPLSFGHPCLGRGAFCIQHHGQLFKYGVNIPTPPHGTLLHLIQTSELAQSYTSVLGHA